jgi:hypothetical protein
LWTLEVLAGRRLTAHAADEPNRRGAPRGRHPPMSATKGRRRTKRGCMAEIYGAELVTQVFAAFPDPVWEVMLDGVHGVSAAFRCRDVMVVSVDPWSADTGASAA